MLEPRHAALRTRPQALSAAPEDRFDTMQARTAAFAAHSPLWTATLLSLGSAISLGISRFSAGLVLPIMREDLGWTYLMAGAMNTSNAIGYLLGALTVPTLLRRFGARPVATGGALSAGIFMMLAGMVTDTDLLLSQRALGGIASAYLFVAGGVLSARLSLLHPRQAGLILGMYSSGTGLGITASALMVPATMEIATANGSRHTWQWAWLLLGAMCVAMTPIVSFAALGIDGALAKGESSAAPKMVGTLPWNLLWRGFASYFMFGAGYIGYITYISILLNGEKFSVTLITMFYIFLGVSVILSSRVWAGTIDRFKGGETMSVLCASLGVATLLPVLSLQPIVVLISGLMFGAMVQAVVASSTALVRHNLPPSAWPAGISAFTIVFAVGQILGPTAVGWIADSSGGLQRGLVFSALALFAGALLASSQRPLPYASKQPTAA